MYQSFHAVALSGERRLVALRSQFPLVGADAATTWVHVAIEGTWKGHPRGPITFTKEIFQQIIRNLERQSNAIVVRYEHPEYTPDGQPILTAGFIHKLEIRPRGLYAFVEFTPHGAELCRAHHYKWCSVVIDFDAIDRKTAKPCGAELFELGLTNVPFIDGLDPIKLSRALPRSARRFSMAAEKIDTDALIKEARKKAGDDATPEKFIEVYQAILELEKKVAGAGGAEPAPEALDVPALTDTPEDATELTDAQPTELAAAPADDATAGLALELLTILQDALGLDAAGVIAWARENAGSLPTSGAGATAESAFSRLSAAEGRIRALTRQRDEAMTKLAKVATDDKAKKDADDQTAAEKRVDALIESGGLLDTEREHAVRLARHDEKWFGEWMAARPPVVPTDRVTGASVKKTTRTAAAQTQDDVDLEPRNEVEKRIVAMNSTPRDRARALAKYRAKEAQTH